MFLNRASRDARYLGLVSLRDMVDRRNDEAVINLVDDDETGGRHRDRGGLQEYVAAELRDATPRCRPPTSRSATTSKSGARSRP